jgi:hypothetical protein
METKETEKKEFVLVRTQSAGVYAGNLISCDKDDVVLSDAIQIWYWDGAATLSQLAMEGTKRPENCKFPMPVKEIRLFGVISIMPVTPEAEKSIKGVKSWKK